jgi:transposase
MGRRRVSATKKIEVATLLKHNSNVSQVATISGVSRCLVRGIGEKIRLNQPLENRPGQGRPRISSPVDDRQLLRLSKKQRNETSRALSQEWSPLVGQAVSSRTVRRRLVEMGMKSYVQKRKPLKTASQVKKRLAWCAEHQLWSADQWQKVIWSDESHFQLVNRCNRVYIRRMSHEGNQPFNFQSRVQGGGGQVSVWGCFSAAGPGPLVCYEGRLNSARYISTIRNALPYFIAANFDLKRDIWYFQQDNAPCHSAKATKKWFEDNAIYLLEWPPSSPDMNPIENIWSIIDQELAKMPITCTADLKREIFRIWEELDVSLCERLVDSLPRRVSSVLRARGKSIMKY